MSRSTEYALIAIQDMSHSGITLVSARELSIRHDLPAGLVAKVLQRLAAAGIAESEKGVHGGYRLACDIEELSFLDLTEAVEGPVRFAACEQSEPGECDRAAMCTVSGPVHALGAEVVGLLSRTSVGSLLRQENNLNTTTEVSS